MRMNDADDLEQQVTDFMNQRKKDSKQVLKYFNYPKVMYAAAK